MREPLGNAKWSQAYGLERYKAEGGDRFFFGCPIDPQSQKYNPKTFVCGYPPGHFLTVAETRSGKGASLIIPNLLCYRGSAVVIDPKGENAWITAPRRREFGQRVAILDPWGEVYRRYGSKVGVEEEIAHFNPLSVLKAGSDDFIEHLAYLADAIIISDSTKDPYWDNSARELVAGLMAYVVENPEFAPHASLLLVRKLLMRPNSELERLIRRTVEEFPDSIAALKLGQFENPEKATGIASVISTARTQTGFLDSKQLGQSMRDSDFSFDDLREGGRPTTVYLVLGPEKLKTYARWLRLMVSIAIGTVQKGPLGDAELEEMRIRHESEDQMVAEAESEAVREIEVAPWMKELPRVVLPLTKESREVAVPDWVKSRYRADIEAWWAQQSADFRRGIEKLHTNPADLAKAKAGAYMGWHYSQKPKAPDGPVGPTMPEPLTELPPSLRTLEPEQSDPELSPEEAAKIAALPVLFLLDEFGTIGRLEEVSKAFGLMAGLGMVIWAFVQNLVQLKDYYGNEWETFVGNVNAMLCFGIMDQFTAEYIEKMLGKRTVRYTTTSKSTSMSTKMREKTMEDIVGQMFGEEPVLEEQAGTSTSQNTTEHVVEQPLFSSTEIRKMHAAWCIVIGHDDPRLCWRVDYYSDPTFSGWARPNPKYAKR